MIRLPMALRYNKREDIVTWQTGPVPKCGLVHEETYSLQEFCDRYIDFTKAVSKFLEYTEEHRQTPEDAESIKEFKTHWEKLMEGKDD